MVTVCLLTLAPASPASGLDLYQRLDQMHHSAWSAKEGLTGEPNCLAQTTDGYLWIGTSNGLYRFDGVAFERYQRQGGALPAVAVSALLAVPDGGLWVGYSRGGATFIGSDGRPVNYTVDQGLPVGTVRSFARDLDGVVWVAAVGGLARLDADRWRTVRMDWNYPCRSAWRLFLERDGTLWVGAASPDRILYLPKGTRRFRDLGIATSAAGFAQTGDNTIAFADMFSTIVHEVRREVDGAEARRTIVELPSQGLALDRDGGLWVAGDDITRLRISAPSGVGSDGRVRPAVERFTIKEGLSGRLSRDVLVDHEGNVWVLTQGGLDRFRRRNLAWKADTQLAPGASLVSDKNGEVWVLSYLPAALRRARDGAPVPNAPDTLDVGFLDPDGSVWLSTTRSFLRWTDGRFIQIPPPDEFFERADYFAVAAAAKDRAGRLWVSISGLGVFYREDEQWTFVPILPGRPDWTAAAAHVDGADRLWLAYRDELAMVERGKVRLFTKADGLDVGPLLALGGRDRQVWITGEQGLAFLHGDRFHVVQRASGIRFGAVAGIVVSRDGVWLSAAIGIVRIPAAEVQRLLGDPEHRVQYELFDLVSDLPEALMVRGTTRAFAPVVEGADGVLWFLTNGGLATVDPRKIVRNTLQPPVLVRTVTADDKTYSPQGAATLPPLTRTIRIDYTALSLSIPERVRFRYRLEGWETDWHDAGTRRTVFYTDLRPGRYVFRVLACNNDGVWNEAGATFAFTVAPAWYQTMWFQGLMAACLLASVATLYRVRLRRVSAALSAKFDERLAERTRIARELHDTLLQTVQGSKMVAEDALDRLGDADHMRRAMERLSDWLGRAVDEGRAALNSLRASTVAVNDLAESLRAAADSPTKPPTLTLSVGVRGESRDLHPIVRDEIYRIGYEAIRNAYAHSKATRLDIEIEYARDLFLRITDNGIGIDPAIAGSGKHGRFGLPGMRERAANIGATLTVVGSASGTSISLVAPGANVFRSGPTSPSH
ncbi:MAG: hypothetical protein GEU99_10775 [Luteitalea sp.]|nr:hypothetical protein [Luteitalea sp.]